MSAAQTQPVPESVPAKSRNVWKWVSLCSLLIVIVTTATGAWFLVRMHREIRNAYWNNITSDYASGSDLIEPQVGTIQFLKSGLSISLTSANYTANGLELSGELGNSRNIYISSITLHISARKPIYACNEKFLRGEFLSINSHGRNFYESCDEIGSGQTAVLDLAPGKKQFFALTIPNVRQTKENPDFDVFISGERYAYY